MILCIVSIILFISAIVYTARRMRERNKRYESLQKQYSQLNIRVQNLAKNKKIEKDSDIFNMLDIVTSKMATDPTSDTLQTALSEWSSVKNNKEK